MEALIRKKQKLSEIETIAVLDQVFDGYRYLMIQNVLHRDLKPPNILKKGGIWKIADFGFAVQGKKKLISEINVGTPTYMAPESLESTYYSHRTDFFALAVICYEMLLAMYPGKKRMKNIF